MTVKLLNTAANSEHLSDVFMTIAGDVRMHGLLDGEGRGANEQRSARGAGPAGSILEIRRGGSSRGPACC